MCGMDVCDREGPRHMYFWVGVGIGKARRRMYFWAEASPPKDGDLSCAQSCRPVSLRETGAGVYLSLVEVGVSEGMAGKAICWWEIGLAPSVVRDV